MVENLQFLNPDDERWAAYLSEKQQANLFHHPAWSQLLSDCYNYTPFVLIISNNDGKIRAGLPLMEVNSRLTGQRWISLPFSDYCLPLYEDNRAYNQLANSLVKLFTNGSIPRIELRWEYPTHKSIQRYSHYVLHTIDIESDVDSVHKRVHKMHQRNIKKAVNEGVRIVRSTTSHDLNMFYNLHLQTRRRQGVPIQPKKFFDLLGRKIIDQGLGFVLLAYKDNEYIAGSVFLNWQKTLIYKYGASNEVGRNLRANHLVMWSAIRWGCENGYRLFDMGKTNNNNTGLRQFKSRWGAVEKPLVYSIISAKKSKQFGGSLQGIMQATIQKSPLWVCRISGELLYKHFG